MITVRPFPLLLSAMLLTGCPTVAPDDDVADDDSAGDPPACDDGFVLDGDECVPAACGTGTWGDLDLDGVVAFVDAAAGDGGDGAQEAPLRTVQAGLDAAMAAGGGGVAVAAGTYAENLVLGDEATGVALQGRCKELVVLDSSGDPAAPGIFVDGMWGIHDLALRDLTVTGDGEIGVWIESADVALVRVDILGARPLGLLVYRSGTEVVLDDVTIAGTRPDVAGDWGYAINVYEGAELVAQDLLLDGNTAVGIMENGGGTSVELHDAVVRDTVPDPGGSFGWGLAAYTGSWMRCVDCLVEGNAAMGVIGSGTGSTVQLEGSAVTDTVPDGNGAGGYGVAARDGATIEATACALERNRANGVYADGYDTLVQLTDTDIRDTTGDAGGYYGQGVIGQEGAAIEIVGGVIERNVIHGVHAKGPLASLSLDGVTIRDTQPDPTGEYGLGLSIHEGTATIVDSQIEGNHGAGLLAYDGALLDVQGTTVTGTLAPPAWGYGRGAEVQQDATLVARDCVLEGNLEMGVVVYNGAHAELENVQILDTAPRADGVYGIAIAAEQQGTVHATSCLLDGNTDVGIFLQHPGTAATLDDVTIRGTQPTASGEFGRGIEVQDQASIELDGCLIEDNAEVGLNALWGAEVVARDTTIRATRRGVITALGSGMAIEAESLLDASGLVIEQCQGPGLLVGDSATALCDGCQLVDNSFAGVVVTEGSLTLTGGEIAGTIPDANQGGGVGAFFQGGPHGIATLLDGVTIADNEYAAVWIVGPGAHQLVGNELWGGAGALYQYPSGQTLQFHGDAVFAVGGATPWDGKTGLLLDGNLLAGAAGPAVFLDGASATLSGNTYQDNALDLLQQDCALVDPPVGAAEAPAQELCPPYGWMTLEFTFDPYLIEHDPIE